MRVLYGTAFGILVFDQITKFFALEFLKPVGRLTLINRVFDLSFVENTGIAFGLFQGHPGFWTLMITASVLCLLIGSRYFKNQSRAQQIAYGFILGGAMGNWVDRIRFERVIDFLDFQIWPVFNFADTFITLGVFLFIVLSLKGR